MLKNKKIAVFLIASLMIFAGGCSSSGKPEAISEGASPPEMSYEEGIPSPDSPAEKNYDEGAGGDFQESENKVIYEYFLQLETRDFDKTKIAMEELVKKAKGYIQLSNTSVNGQYEERSYRTGQYLFRVPADKAGDISKDLIKTGHLIEERSGSKDVTYQHQDMESRINSLEAQEKRLNQLYERADRIEDVIVLEERIANVIREKESLKNQLKTLNNRISYAVIEVTLREVVDITVVEDVKTTFGKRLSNAFSESFRLFGDSLENIAVSIVYSLPWLIIMIGLGTGGFFLYRKWNRKE